MPQPPIHIGFTGSQYGLTTAQARRLEYDLDRVSSFYHSYTGWGTMEVILHHGDCIGADEAVHFLAHERRWKVVIHPPTNESKRAFCQMAEIMPPQNYMQRNQDIVDSADILFATPRGPEDRYPRSGTWATIRRALRKGIGVVIYMPDGSKIEERGWLRARCLHGEFAK